MGTDGILQSFLVSGFDTTPDATDLTPMKATDQNLSGFSCSPVGGRIFEDTIDGYFPLHESIRQLLLRQQLRSAWVSIVEAPFINLKSTPDTSPLPMKLPCGTSTGNIQYMALVASLGNNGIQLRGAARWSWLTGQSLDTETFPNTARLAEPAFIRGIGLLAGDLETNSFGRISRADSTSNLALVKLSNQPASVVLANLGWDTALLWGLQHSENHILRLNKHNACLAAAVPNSNAIMADQISHSSTDFEYLAIHLHDKNSANAVKKLAAEY